jgi:hypothetical protein
VQSRQWEPELVPGPAAVDIGIPERGLEEALDLAAAEEQLLIRLYEQVSPSVVNIAVDSAQGRWRGLRFCNRFEGSHCDQQSFGLVFGWADSETGRFPW